MKTYKVNVIEHNEMQIEIDAESEEEAIEEARRMYGNGELFFDGTHGHYWQEYLIERGSC